MPYADPEKQRAAARESARRRRAGLAGEKKRRTARMRLATAADVQRMLGQAANDIRALDCDPIARGRSLAYIAGVILKCLEVGELEARVAALEEHAPQIGAGRGRI